MDYDPAATWVTTRAPLKAKVTSREMGPQHWRFELRDVYSFADSYHYGVLEGTVLAFSRKPEIRMRRLARLSDADFDVRWQ